MTIEEKKNIIKEHPVFQGLDNNNIAFIAEHVQDRIYPPNTIVIRQGEPSQAVYFNYAGLLKIYVINESGKYIPVKTSEEKDFVGDLGAFDGEPVPATVETIKETCVLILGRKISNMLYENTLALQLIF